MRFLPIFFLFLLLLPPSVHAEARVDVPLGDSPSQGAADAPVTVVEFIDFQ